MRPSPSTLRRPASLARSTAGSSAIEFAIIAPVFLMLVLGMIAYAIYFGAAHSLQQLTADATRASVAGVSDAERRSIVSTYFTRHASGYMLLDAANLTVVAAASAGDPDQFEVRVVYDAHQLPIWALAPFLPLPSERMVARSSIRIGGG